MHNHRHLFGLLLVILPPVAYTYQAINAPSTRSALAYDTRLVYDAERQSLFGVDRIDQQIEIYTPTAGAWSANAPYVLPQLTDLALSPDGRLLLALTQGAVSDIPLTGAPFTATPRASNPTAFCGQFLDSLSVTNDGIALVNSKYSGCSGFTQVYGYDERSYTQPRCVRHHHDGRDAGRQHGIHLGQCQIARRPGELRR